MDGIAPKITKAQIAADVCGIVLFVIGYFASCGAYGALLFFGIRDWPVLLYPCAFFGAALFCWRQFKLLAFWCVGVAIFAGFACLLANWIPSEPLLSEKPLQEDGNRMVAVLKQYYEEHDSYPVALEEAGVMSLQFPMAPWEYEVGMDLQSYWLRIHANKWTDYFCLSYHSDIGEWWCHDL